MKSGRKLLKLSTGSAGVASVAWNRDSRYLAIGLQNGHVLVWDLASGKALVKMRAHKGQVWSIAWSSDDKRLATAGDEIGAIWDASTGEKLQALRGHTSYVTEVAWSPDDRHVFTNGWDDIRVWEPASGNCEKVIKDWRQNLILLARGDPPPQFQMQQHEIGSIVQAQNRNPVAWLVDRLDKIEVHLSGHAWAGRTESDHLFIVVLEGQSDARA